MRTTNSLLERLDKIENYQKILLDEISQIRQGLSNNGVSERKAARVLLGASNSKPLKRLVDMGILKKGVHFDQKITENQPRFVYYLEECRVAIEKYQESLRGF